MELHDSLANLAIRPITILDISAPLLFAIIILSGLRVSEVNEICSTFKNVLATRLRNSPIALDLDQMHEHDWLRKVVAKVSIGHLMKIDFNMTLRATFMNEITGVLSSNGNLTWGANPHNFPNLTNVKLLTKTEYPNNDVQQFLAICGENRSLCCFSEDNGPKCVTYSDQIQSFVCNPNGEVLCLKTDGKLISFGPTGNLLKKENDVQTRGGVKTMVSIFRGFVLHCHDGSVIPNQPSGLSQFTKIVGDRAFSVALVYEDTQIIINELGAKREHHRLEDENKVEQILGILYGFAARMTDGSVMSWWYPYGGRNKSFVGRADKIYATENIFAALQKNTSNGVFFWRTRSKLNIPAEIKTKLEEKYVEDIIPRAQDEFLIFFEDGTLLLVETYSWLNE